MPFEKAMTSKDFSFLMEKAPGVFGFIGGRSESVPGSEISNHHECCTVDEKILARGAALAAQFALDFLAQRLSFFPPRMSGRPMELPLFYVVSDSRKQLDYP